MHNTNTPSAQDQPSRHGQRPARGIPGLRDEMPPEYNLWCDVLRRCEDAKHHLFHKYGGKGVTICDRWRDFWLFLADLGERPEGHILGRLDLQGGYEPANACWMPRSAYMRRFRQSHRYPLTHGGQTLTLCEWARYLGIPFDTLRWRLRHGWTIEEAFMTRPNQANGIKSRRRMSP